MLSPSQQSVLALAANTATELGEDPKLIQAIALVESSAGAQESEEASYGVMQVSILAAEDVIYHFRPKLPFIPSTENDLQVALTLDKAFNIRVGTLYLKLCYRWSQDWNAALVCYNAGRGTVAKMSPEQVDNHPYVKKVRRAYESL